MAENCSRKLYVEICNAKNLMPKDGQGTASAYVVVDFDGQRRRTQTKSRDLNPQWDEKLEFLVHDVASMPSQLLQIIVYNDKMSGKRSTFLGKVKISGTTFPKTGSESLVYYPLEKRSVFSQIKGEIGLKVWFVDEEPVPPPPTEGEKKVEVVTETNAEEKKPDEAKTGEEEKKTEEVKKEADAGTDTKEASKPEEAKVEEATATTPVPVPVVENPPVAQKPKAMVEKRG